MDVQVHDDIPAWSRLARSIYATDPVRHTGAVTALASVEKSGRASAVLSVREAGDLRGVFVADVGWPAMISGLPATTAEPAAEALAASGVSFPGASGPEEESEAFAAAWASAAGVVAKRGFEQLTYALGTLVEPRGVPGEFRLADAADTELLLKWRAEFLTEAVHSVPAEADPVKALEAARSGGNVFGFWCVNGAPVSMAFARDPVCDMTRIGYVYTPPEYRGHGYAAAVTAGVSRWAQDQDIRHISLFTDASNPVSNRIYQRLGYRFVVRYVEHSFDGQPLRH